MYIYIYIYVYIIQYNTHTHTHSITHAHIWTYIFMCMYIYIYIIKRCVGSYIYCMYYMCYTCYICYTCDICYIYNIYYVYIIYTPLRPPCALPHAPLPHTYTACACRIRTRMPAYACFSASDAPPRTPSACLTRVRACLTRMPQRLMLCVGCAPATASKTHAGSAGAGSSDTAGKQGLQVQAAAGSAGAGSSDTAGKQGLQVGLQVQAAAGSAGAGSSDTAGKQPERQRRSAGKIRERVVEVVEVVEEGGAGGADDAETETDAALSPDPEV